MLNREKAEDASGIVPETVRDTGDEGFYNLLDEKNVEKVWDGLDIDYDNPVEVTWDESVAKLSKYCKYGLVCLIAGVILSIGTAILDLAGIIAIGDMIPAAVTAIVLLSFGFAFGLVGYAEARDEGPDYDREDRPELFRKAVILAIVSAVMIGIETNAMLLLIML